MHTHVYCPECKTYYHNSAIKCNHGLLHMFDFDKTIYTEKYIPVVIKNKIIKKYPYKKLHPLLETDKLFDKINSSIRQSSSGWFRGTTYYIFLVTNKKDIAVESYRVDHVKVNPYDPSGVARASLFIKMHKINEIISCDGILNLYSKKVLTKSKINVYEAVWVKESRILYTDYALVEGFIAKKGSLCYHSKSIDNAIKGLENKIQQQKEYDFLEKESKKIQLSHQVEFLNKIPEDLMITYQDSIDAGNCSIGTDYFIDKYNLNKTTAYSAKYVYTLDPTNTDLKKVILLAINKFNKNESEKKTWGFKIRYRWYKK